ncbi:hypothetical protein OUZ56_007609 [Daphnia magna]|uniref:Uncharacterized protein n=1 Tax=Daphnia magna TaxID=35525 RepID=A0ABR0AAL7_9CRUS|nr:hypothetical protein OUZ56_007609 [Daphnia magna]
MVNPFIPPSVGLMRFHYRKRMSKQWDHCTRMRATVVQGDVTWGMGGCNDPRTAVADTSANFGLAMDLH